MEKRNYDYYIPTGNKPVEELRVGDTFKYINLLSAYVMKVLSIEPVDVDCSLYKLSVDVLAKEGDYFFQHPTEVIYISRSNTALSLVKYNNRLQFLLQHVESVVWDLATAFVYSDRQQDKVLSKETLLQLLYDDHITSAALGKSFTNAINSIRFDESD